MPLKTLTGDRAGPRKGRGAGINPEGRFEREGREGYDDGWGVDPDEDLPPLKTHVTAEYAKTIITRNDSPDIPFTQSINPYRGCEHGCVYCLSGETLILMADGNTRPLAEVQTGDVIYGTARKGWYRRYVKTRVLAHWSVIKPAYKVTLEDGTSLIAGGDHRFLTERGWKFVADADKTPDGRAQRPHLTVNNKLKGVGAFARTPLKSRDYKLGYLCGMIRGDANLRTYEYTRPGRVRDIQHRFRLALCDDEGLDRTRDYLLDREIQTQEFVFQRAVAGRRDMRAIRTSSALNVGQIRTLIAWPAQPSRGWMAGFLAGIFDAEGSYSGGTLRISNTDAEMIAWTVRSLRSLGFACVVEHVSAGRPRPIDVVRVTGGLREHLRFFHTVDPAITRKRDIAGQAVKSSARLRVVSVEPYARAMRLYDITTETEDFIANGVVSHNCFARPSHAYLNLSPGLDFETRLFAKVNAAELLRKELAKPGYRCSSIALGANTDPDQPVEREWKVTRGIIEVLAACDHPVGIVTKNALVERDLDLLAPMAAKGLAAVYVSVTNLDNDLSRKLEPRASAPARRLETIRRLAAAGVRTGVMVAPVIPFLTDDQLERILEAAREAGAVSAGYIVMRLPYEVKDLFRDWLRTHYPLKADHVMSRVHAMRGGRDNDPEFGSRMTGTGEYADLLRRRFSNACRRLGFNQERRGQHSVTGLFRPPKIERADGQMALF
jgi:DNA repair photolyase